MRTTPDEREVSAAIDRLILTLRTEHDQPHQETASAGTGDTA